MKYPRYLYRFFGKKDHRDQFIQGLVRFGRLEVYRKVEDEKRKDIDEGKPRGWYKTDRLMFLKISNETGKVVERGLKSGDINISGYSPNNFFIVSMVDENADLNSLAKKFGKYVVKVNNSQKLLDLINMSCKFSWKVGRIVLKQVKYDRDKYIVMEKNNAHLPFEYYFAQKSEIFVEEKEWRMVLIGSAIEEVNKKYVIVEVGSLEGITSTIDL